MTNATAASRSRTLSRVIETGANLATVVLAVVALAWWFGKAPPPDRTRGQQPAPVAGDTVDLAKVGGVTSPSLLMFLRSDCKYCTASAPFYRDLSALEGSAPLVAVFGEPKDSGVSYLKSIDVRIPDVRSIESLQVMGVLATPALVLVKPDGTVLKSWVGQLPPAEERQLLQDVKLSTLKE